MALTHNNPGYYYISWENLLITYEGTLYQIQNSYTNLKYVYWDVTSPYELQCFNRTQNTKPGFYQLFINDRGQATERSHEDLIISWDGNNTDLIMSQIYGIHQDNKENGKKFVAMETDINGIKNTVGEVQQSSKELNEKVSKIEQTSKEIGLSVRDLKQEFTNNKEVNELRENINSSIIDFNSSLGLFKSEMYTYYKDKKTDEEEKVKINTQLDILDSKKASVVKYTDVVVNIMQSKDQTTEVNRLNSAKTKFLNSVKNLRTYITTVISDSTVVPSEITGMVDLFAKCSVAIKELKNTCDDCIFLGAGGKITDELANIIMKSDEISLSVSKTEEDIKSNLSIEKNLLQGNVTDLRNATEKFIKVLNILFSDGEVNAEESKLIDENILLMNKEKSDIDSSYSGMYENVNISEQMKNTLLNSYNSFNNKYNTMISKINSVIEDIFVNDSEKAQTMTTIDEMLTELTKYHPIACQAMDDIRDNKYKAEIKAAKDALQREIIQVDEKVNELGGIVDGSFEDNILDKTERQNIENDMIVLNREKVDIDNQYNTYYKNTNLDGQLKIDFKNSYDDYILKYNKLIEKMTEILNKQTLIDNLDRENLQNANTQLNTTIGEFVKRVNEVIEYVNKKEVNKAKEDLNNQIEDVENGLSDLGNTLNTTFKDGIISETEVKMIESDLNRINREKSDIDTLYEQLYNNPNLI